MSDDIIIDNNNYNLIGTSNGNINDNNNIIDTSGEGEGDTLIDTSGEGVYAATAGNPSVFVVHSSESQEHVTTGLHVSIDGPDEPDIHFYHLKNGDIAVRYVPAVAGVYILTVTFNNKHIRGSPFKVNVRRRGSISGDPLILKRNLVHKVKLSGPGMEDGHVDEVREIYIDVSRAELNDKRDFLACIDGPMKPEYSVEEKEKGIITLAYKATMKGIYRFIISFHWEHVPGSPFTVSIN